MFGSTGQRPGLFLTPDDFSLFESLQFVHEG
jgi:hypothetical protein